MSKRLFEAMIEANHRALEGDAHAGLHPADYADELPLVALSCVDVRLNSLLPQALGVPPDQFVWLRNAGNIVTGPMSSTMRSLALACAVKGGKEIVVIGHTDCQVGKTTAMELLDRFRALGVERHMLPENLNEYFGIFASDRQNVLKAVEFVRGSPLIGPKVPVQGLLIDIETGKLEWLVNGYEDLGRSSSRWTELVHSAGESIDALKPLAGFNFGEMKFPETKIGELVSVIGDELARKLHPDSTGPGSATGGTSHGPASPMVLPPGFNLGEMKFPPTKIGEVIATVADELSRKLHHAPTTPATPPKTVPPGPPPRIPIPPPIRPKIHLRRGPK